MTAGKLVLKPGDKVQHTFLGSCATIVKVGRKYLTVDVTENVAGRTVTIRRTWSITSTRKVEP
jgi:hypothetical protein